MNQGWLRLPSLLSMLSRMCLSRNGRENQSAWLQEAAKKCADLLHLEVEWDGVLPTNGLVVANHMGYLDVIALASILPCRFIAKMEVQSWPLFGRCATNGGTLYINRNSRSAVTQTCKSMAEALQEPLPLVLFPEGTSSDGKKVLPFHPSLLEAALRVRSPIAPAHISYDLPGGLVETEVAYHGDMVLLPHLANLLGHQKIQARVRFGSSQMLDIDRKTAARILRDQVEALSPHARKRATVCRTTSTRLKNSGTFGKSLIKF